MVIFEYSEHSKVKSKLYELSDQDNVHITQNLDKLKQKGIIGGDLKWRSGLEYRKTNKEVDLLKLFKACGGVNVEKCWLNYTRKGFPDHYCWHTHPHRYTCVYYFDDGPGTVFKGIRKNFQINVLKDTLVVFPAHLFHSAPLHDESERYTIAFDFDGY